MGSLPVERRPPGALARRLHRAETLSGISASSRSSCNRTKEQSQRTLRMMPQRRRRERGEARIRVRRHYRRAPRGRRGRGDGGGGLGCSPFSAEGFANFWRAAGGRESEKRWKEGGGGHSGSVRMTLSPCRAPWTVVQGGPHQVTWMSCINPFSDFFFSPKIG